MRVMTKQGRVEDIMTDKQFDAVLEMAIQILRRADDLSDAEKALQAIKRGGDDPSAKTKNKPKTNA